MGDPARAASRSIAGAIVYLTLAALWLGPTAMARAAPGGDRAVLRLANGVVLPYPLDNLFRGWTECASRRGHHKALDIGGVGPHAGLGTPVRAMGPGRVLSIGLPSEEPERFGEPLTDCETTVRSRRELPTHFEVEGYGDVYFFTKDYGRHRSGGTLTLRVDAGPLKGHTIRYMHLAAVHPGVAVGERVASGQELGLMGGTAVLEDSPHLHLAIENARGKALDVGRVLGFGSTRLRCRASKALRARVRGRYQKQARALMKQLREEVAATRLVEGEAPQCGRHVMEGSFEDGAVRAVLVRWPAPGEALPRGGGPWTVRVEPQGGRWTPTLAIRTAAGDPLFDGRRATAFADKAYRFRLKRRGRPGRHAEVQVERAPAEALLVEVGAVESRSGALKGGTFALTLERACPAQELDSGPPEQ